MEYTEFMCRSIRPLINHRQDAGYSMTKFNAWLLIGIIGISLFGSQFGIRYGRAVWGDPYIWWTPKTMALALNDTRQDFEIFLNDELLQNHLERGSLSAADLKGQSSRVVSDDITVRLNNWHKSKAPCFIPPFSWLYCWE